MNPVTVNPIERFMQVFSVQEHALATRFVTYNAEKNIFQSSPVGVEVYGDTCIVSLNASNGEEIIEIPHTSEVEFICEMSELFASFSYDEPSFIAHVKEKFKEK